MQIKKSPASLLALTSGVYGKYTNRPFKSQIPGSVRPMKQTSQKFPVVVTSLPAMLLVALLESRVSKASISGSRKKSISTHFTYLGEDSVYECQETTKKELSQKLPASSQLTWTVIFLQPITNSTTWVFFYTRSFLPISSAGPTGPSHPQAQLRTNQILSSINLPSC